MKVTLERAGPVEIVDIELTFPLYFNHHYEDDHGYARETWARIEADGSMFSITEAREGRGPSDWEIELERIDLRRNLDRYVEEGGQWDPSDQWHFNEALNACRTLLVTEKNREFSG